MTEKLRLAENLSLPLKSIAHAIAILAIRGAGKTYAALKLVEEVFTAGVQTCVVDPTGACWGLRANAGGKGPGLPIVILGGEHGDVPLESTAGEVVAHFLVEARQSVVLDLSPFRKGEALRFMTDFGETIYRLKHREQYREPLLFVLDEADAFAPQKPYKGMERCLGAMEDIVRRGRFRGLFPVMVTQRSAVLNKDVFNQCEILVALRTMGSQDIHAWDDWMEKQGGTVEQRDTLLGEIASLPTGTAWVWAPVLHLFKKVQIAARETFDSSATPEVGVKRRQPKVLASVDLEELKKRMAATIERKQAEDPRHLLTQIAALKEELRRKPQALVPAIVHEIKKPVFRVGEVRALNRAAQALEGAGSKIVRAANAVGKLVPATQRLSQAANEVVALGEKLVRSMEDAKPGTNGIRRTARVDITQVMQPPPMPKARLAEVPREVREGVEGLKAGMRRMLAVMGARHPGTITRAQMGTLAKIAKGGGTFSTYLGILKERGYIVEDGNHLVLTSGGVQAAAAMEPIGAVHEMWSKALKRGARVMLQVLAAWHPVPLTRGQVAVLAKISARGGTFSTYIGTLKDNHLVDEIGEGLTITADGLRVSGIAPWPPRSAKELVERFAPVLKRGIRHMLDVLLGRWPNWMDRAQWAGQAEVKQTGGTFSTYVGILRQCELIEESGGQVKLSTAFLERVGISG